MALSVASTLTLPPSVTLDSLRKLSADLASRAEFLRRRSEGFERNYACSLDELNRRLAARQIAEHPAWEDSIEWGNAADQLAQVELLQSIVSWLISSLKPSSSS
jgi:hypothetical protein